MRIKPLGAGGGGGERSGAAGVTALHATDKGVLVTGDPGSSRGVVSSSARRGGGRLYSYPRHVCAARHDNAAIYGMFMPQRVELFLKGCSVNILAYGQTGSGKTHTMFGPPRIMAKAASGTFGTDVCPDYGLCPRGLLDIVARVAALRRAAAGATRYELTVSAVELTLTDGNVDMFTKRGAEKQKKEKRSLVDMVMFSGASGVSLDRTTKPPVLFGQQEVPVNAPEDLLALFGALACRNTAATGMNDSSSRSHCFVFLNLYAHDVAARTVRHSRFQFVDMAGSERLKDAHGNRNTSSGWGGDVEASKGMMTNFTLMLLSQRVRELASARGQRREVLVQRSFKTQGDPDLLPLVAESLTGEASTLVCVCVSSAPDNTSQSVNALGFGKEFAKLSVRPRVMPATKLAAWEARAAALVAAGAGGGGGGKPRHRILRAAKGRAGRQMQAMLARLTGDGGGAAGGGGGGGAAPKPAALAKRAKVEVQKEGGRGAGRWFRATVDGLNQDGTYDVEFADGQSERHVTRERIRQPGGSGVRRREQKTEVDRS